MSTEKPLRCITKPTKRDMEVLYRSTPAIRLTFGDMLEKRKQNRIEMQRSHYEVLWKSEIKSKRG